MIGFPSAMAAVVARSCYTGTPSNERREHRCEQSLRREPKEDREQHEQCELQREADEAQVAPVAFYQPEQQRDTDRGEREKQQQPNEDQVAPSTAQSWNADGTSSSVSNATNSQASLRASKARASALLSAWPGLNAVYCPISGWPRRYRSPIASSTLCLTNSLS